MKVSLAILSLCTISLHLTPSTVAQSAEKNYYSRRYDSLDVNLIFRSSRLLNNYVDCLLDKKPCPPEGKDLKRVLPDALRTRCAQCTKLQKGKALDVITRLYYQYPSIYTALAERYDPTGEYTKNFENWFDEQNAVKPRPPIPQDQSQFDVPDNVQLGQAPGIENVKRDDISTQQAVRRSPNIGNSNVRPNPNEIPTKRTRIPSTWITSSTTTTRRPTTTRAPLRTSSPVNRPITVRSPSVTSRPPQQSPQTNFLFENIFAPRPEGPITKSINRFLDTTGKVVNDFAGMFRTTFQIITGTG
ncbi:CLUMA_CG015024, isoform A [Clunio marinus]|uniref:CLUMA_CG015024, isoform A n=1 Tax=Clunio marinus TaxID=568069 RepID=A0A1J1INS2_9DIPT|nr:CLUMA_CG015024, isoform A [Clunio marinus]